MGFFKGVCVGGIIGGLIATFSIVLFGKGVDWTELISNIIFLIGITILLVLVCVLLLICMAACTAFTMLFLLVCYGLSFFGVLEILGFLPFCSTVLGGFRTQSPIKRINATLQLWGGIEHLSRFFIGLYRSYKAYCYQPVTQDQGSELTALAPLVDGTA